MRAPRRIGMAMLGAGCLWGTLIAMSGCGAGTPPTGSRAIVAANHLEQQQAKIEQIRASRQARPSTKSSIRR